MDLIAKYGAGTSSSDDEKATERATTATADYRPLEAPSAAPDVDTAGLKLVSGDANGQLSAVVAPAAAAASGRLLDPGAREAFLNLPVAQMHAPLVGPTRSGGNLAQGSGAGGAPSSFNSRSGHVEDVGVADFHFDDQLATFDARGWASSADGRGGVVGDASAFAASGGATAMAGGGGDRKRRRRGRAEPAEYDPDDDESWAPSRRSGWTGKGVKPARPSAEQVAWLKKGGFIKEEEEEEGEGEAGEGEEAEGKKPTPVVTTSTANPVPASAVGTSKFHAKPSQRVDALGRPWCLPPPRAARRSAPDACRPPRSLARSVAGAHSGKGVAAVRYFPRTGHLLLSAGLDGTAKVWDSGSSDAADRFGGGDSEFSYRCWRTYSSGASTASSKSAQPKGLRDANFDNLDGSTFATASYDKNVKVWDVEAGRALAVLGNGKGMFYCVEFHPGGDGDSSMGKNVLLAGCSDRKVYQFDVRSGDVVQEYDYHLGAVNTVTFFDGGRRFASTSDDKTIRVWEFGIPVQTRVVADPEMHAVPAAAAHPLEPYVAMQSMDNRVLVYSTKDKFKAYNRKSFGGHTVAGYACRPCFSPDGKFLASGDGRGKCFVWDWGSTKVVRSWQAHDAGSVCIDVAWHPLDESRMATAGWDGSVRFWE